MPPLRPSSGGPHICTGPRTVRQTSVLLTRSELHDHRMERKDNVGDREGHQQQQHRVAGEPEHHAADPVLPRHLRVRLHRREAVHVGRKPPEPLARPVVAVDEAEVPPDVVEVVEEEEAQGVEEDVFDVLRRPNDKKGIQASPQHDPARHENVNIQEALARICRLIMLLQKAEQPVNLQPRGRLVNENEQAVEDETKQENEAK
mmetsp:Transcript_46888/g.133755  ORF Transcript_46888/g.133755 Transcript_46888/m.133755 type:complete len:203 (-) Transcript_46888:562-1170(-)